MDIKQLSNTDLLGTATVGCRHTIEFIENNIGQEEMILLKVLALFELAAEIADRIKSNKITNNDILMVHVYVRAMKHFAETLPTLIELPTEVLEPLLELSTLEL